MGQAGLVQGLEKLTIDAPAIAHQKAGKVRPQYHGRLFKSASRLNRIDADLRGAEDPHPPQLSTHSPSGLVRGHWDWRELVSPALDRSVRLCWPHVAMPDTVHRHSPAVRRPPPARRSSCRRAVPNLY